MNVIAHGIGHVENDFRMRSTEGVTDNVVDLYLTARPDTACALDTGIQIDGDGRVGKVGGGRHAWLKTRIPDPHFFCPITQLIVELVFMLRHVGQQQFKHHLLRGDGTLVVGTDFHIRFWRAAAGRRQYTLALDFHHAGAAVAVGAHAVHIAKMRNFHAIALGGLNDGFAFKRVNGFAVQIEGNGLR